MMNNEKEVKTMLDFNGAKIKAGVQIQTAYNPSLGITLWVNIDGICRLRVVGVDPKKFEQDLVSIPSK